MFLSLSEQFLSSGNAPNISCEQKNSFKMEPSKETTQLSAVESYVEPAVDIVLSSLPERPASCLPSTSSDSSLAGANKSFEKVQKLHKFSFDGISSFYGKKAFHLLSANVCPEVKLALPVILS